MIVHNGAIRMGSNPSAVDARYIQNGSSRFEDLLIDGDDVAWCGISTGSGCLIRNCVIHNCNNIGIIGNSDGGISLNGYGGQCDGNLIVSCMIRGNMGKGTDLSCPVPRAILPAFPVGD